MAASCVEQGTHDELIARSALYRTLLSGLEEVDAATIGDSIEALADHRVDRGSGRHHRGGLGRRPAAIRQPHRRRAPSARRRSAPGSAAAGPAGGSTWRPTPELLARVARLRRCATSPTSTSSASRDRTGSFSLLRLLREFRRPLLLGLVLVVIDGLMTLAGPVLVKTGLDDGVSKGSSVVLFAAAGVFLVVTLVDLVDEIGETFVTGRTAQRIMLSLRIRIWAQLQRLSLDYYEREMAGRIMTRMTTDVDQFESLIENGLLSALVSIVTFVGVGVALVVINTELGLWTLSVAIPLAVATVVFRRKAARLYSMSRERIAIVNADFQESLSGVRESQAFVHEDAAMAQFHRLGRAYLDTRVAAQRLVAMYFPVRPVHGGGRRRDRARRRCAADPDRASHRRER